MAMKSLSIKKKHEDTDNAIVELRDNYLKKGIVISYADVVLTLASIGLKHQEDLDELLQEEKRGA
jgi:hypothetical protein